MSSVSSLSARSVKMDTAYHPVQGKSEVQAYATSAHSVNATQPRKSKRRFPLSLHILSHLLGFLWMAPIITLLVLNYKKHIIGASIWCPGGKCDAKAFDDNAIAQASKLDREDHNVLGALQFVSKALEVWFMVIATSLVYDVALYLAKRGGGLPIGYLFTHLEFGDIRNLVNPLMWTSPLPHGNLMPGKPSGTWKLWMFAILAASLTILTNLMGPASAVLVLPTMQWVDTERLLSQRFHSYVSAQPPTVAAFSGCNGTQQLGRRNYTCTYDQYGQSLENFATQLEASAAQYGQPFGNLLLASSQENDVSFMTNISTNGDLFWVATRQVLRDLSSDLFDLSLSVTGQTENLTISTSGGHAQSYNNSLETVLQREGPSLGMAGDCYLGFQTIKELDVDKEVRCFGNYTLVGAPNRTWTKCYRYGVGWADTNHVNSFNLAGSLATDNASTVVTYFSDKATFLNDTTDFGSGIQKCLAKDAKPCDWDAIFNTQVDPILQNSTINVLVNEYSSQTVTEDGTRFYCDANFYSSFPKYSVDTSSAVNPQRITYLNGLPQSTDKNFNSTALVVHPDWLLAAWSIANNGTVDPSTRTIGKTMANLLYESYQGVTPDQTEVTFEQLEFALLHIYMMTQSLSLINFEYTNDTSSAPGDSKGLKVAEPLLHKWSTIRVWAYGITGRTAKLGVVVVILGCVCVLLRLILALALRIRHEHSTVELFVAALEHHPTNEFENISEEKKLAKIKYVMDDGQGRPKFMSERVYSGGLGTP